MNKLKPNDKVAIIAPSGQIGDINKISLGLEYLRSLGLKPVLAKHLLAQNRYMAGSDIERAEDVNKAFADKSIKAVFCVRAAAGASRILPYIDYELIKKNKKPLIGFCDNVALQLALFKKANLISWNGFLLTYDFKDGSLDSLVKDSFENILNGKPLSIKSGKTLKNGTADGKLICSNLSVLLKLAGTPYFPDLRGKILLIEDVHERIHKIDLMLQQLKQQPHFSELRGIIFGHFTDCSGDEEDGSVGDCIADFLAGTNIPVIQDFEFGHTQSRYVLPLGAKAELNADECTLKIASY